MPKKCEDCRYYEAMLGQRGHCLRYPPKGTPSEEDGGWQEVIRDMPACGEFKQDTGNGSK